MKREHTHWSNCKGGINCKGDALPSPKKKQYKRKYNRVVRRRNKLNLKKEVFDYDFVDQEMVVET